MIATGHNAIGTTIGLLISQQTQDPLTGIGLGLAFGLIFHYLADFIPHGHIITNEQFGKLPPVLFIDLFGSFLFLYLIVLFKFGSESTSLIVLAAIGASQLPDVSEGLLYFKKIPYTGLIKWENKVHQQIFHWHGQHKQALKWSWKRDWWQISVALLTLVLLINS